MTKPFLTIACATFDDFNGVFFTIQHYRMFHDVADCEFIVLDNNPDSSEGQATKSFIDSVRHVAPVRYIPYTEIGGTSQPRNRLVEEAQGEFVLISDPHVMVQANGIHNLKKYLRSLDKNEQKNLFTGPLLYDGLNWLSTHFEPEWGEKAQMLGIWATAWRHPDGTLVVCRNIDNRVHIRPMHPEGEGEYQSTEIPWAGHEKALMDRGYKVVGMNNEDAPFEVPGQGFGLFVTSKEHWIPFNRDFRGFGGEEIVHHKLYRNNGRKTMCLPFMKWNHRFGRPGGVPYPLTMENKIRNYLLGFDQVGWDREGVRKHFVDDCGVSPAIYEAIAKDPLSFTPYQKPKPSTVDAVATSNLGMPLPTAYQTLNDVVGWVAATPRDLDQHAGAFMRWGYGMNSAVEITKRRESTAFLLGALGRKVGCGKCGQEETCSKERCNKPAAVHSFQEEKDTLLGILQDMVKTHPGRPLEFTIIPSNHDTLLDDIPEADLLFIDTRHTGDRLIEELTRYAPRISSRIMIHDTSMFGMVGEGNTKGMFWAIQIFIKQNPDWFVADHQDMQYGMTVLSRLPEDRPPETIKPYPGLMDKDGFRCGVGQEIKASLKLLGIVASEGCSCNRKAIMYDDWGPAKCRENMDEILEGLKEEADARSMGHLFIRPAVKLMVCRAIRAAEKKIQKGECS